MRGDGRWSLLSPGCGPAVCFWRHHSTCGHWRPERPVLGGGWKPVSENSNNIIVMFWDNVEFLLISSPSSCLIRPRQSLSGGRTRLHLGERKSSLTWTLSFAVPLKIGQISLLFHVQSLWENKEFGKKKVRLLTEIQKPVCVTTPQIHAWRKVFWGHSKEAKGLYLLILGQHFKIILMWTRVSHKPHNGSLKEYN